MTITASGHDTKYFHSTSLRPPSRPFTPTAVRAGGRSLSQIAVLKSVTCLTLSVAALLLDDGGPSASSRPRPVRRSRSESRRRAFATRLGLASVNSARLFVILATGTRPSVSELRSGTARSGRVRQRRYISTCTCSICARYSRTSAGGQPNISLNSRTKCDLSEKPVTTDTSAHTALQGTAL